MNIDDLIQKRKSIRSFTDEVVAKEQLEAVIEAGRLAPFAGLAQAGTSNFRHFFVLRRGTPVCEKLMELVTKARLADLKDVEEKHLELAYPAYANAVKNMSQKKPMDLFLSPLLIIVAERAGMPAREHVALGYVLSNMWLKATDLGLGMKLCSGVGDIKDTSALKELLGLPKEEEFAFDGCNLGIASDTLYREDVRPVPEASITYL